MPNPASSRPASAGPAIWETWSTVWPSADAAGTRSRPTRLGMTAFRTGDSMLDANASSAASRYSSHSGGWPAAASSASTTQPSADRGLARDQQQAPVEGVGDGAGGHRAEQQRAQRGQADQADLQRRSGLAVDLVGQRHRRELRPAGGDQVAGPEPAKRPRVAKR